MQATAAEGGEATWTDDYAAAMKLAKETGRPILADFSGSDWCGWCIKLDKEVFSKPEFAAYAKDNLVLLMLDFPQDKEQTAAVKEQNAKLSEQFGIQGFPTVLILDADGKEIARTGYQSGGAASYVDHIKSLLPTK
jgi:protein disulfide-isomerase